MAGKVIDLLQDPGLPPPRRGRLILPNPPPPQMENKLPFKHIKKEKKMTRRAPATKGRGEVQL